MRNGISETATPGVCLALIGFLGCGGGGGGSSGSCATPKCGGNLVGRWVVTSACFNISGAPTECPQQISKVLSATFTGGVTYTADMTYAAAVSFSVDLETTLPTSCLTRLGQTVTCAQLQAAIMADPDSGYQSITCTSPGSGCTCTGTIVQDGNPENGTWSAAGGVLTETADGEQPDQADYCVQGNTLQIVPHIDMAMSMMMGDYSLTLTKQ